MATWVDPVDSQTDPDAPITSDLAKRWDNNVIAAFEGAPGAERLDADATGGSVAGDVLLFSSGPGVVYQEEGFVPEFSFRATTACQVRITGEFQNSVTITIYHNTNVIRSASRNQSGYVSWGSNDIDLVAGDIVRVLVAGGSPSVRNVIYSTGPKRSVGGI